MPLHQKFDTEILFVLEYRLWQRQEIALYGSMFIAS